MGNQPPISLTFDISTKYPMKYEVTARSYQMQNAQGNPAQPAQANLLDLMQDDEMSQAELANMTGKSRSTISRQIKQLEAAGAIVRMPSGKYRRNN